MSTTIFINYYARVVYTVNKVAIRVNSQSLGFHCSGTALFAFFCLSLKFNDKFMFNRRFPAK